MGMDVEKKVVVAYFKVLSRKLPGDAERNDKKLSQDILPPGRDLNPGPPEYEAGMLTTPP
jgi:hypothetical protein